MQTSLLELEELREMRENVHRNVDALELCWSCQQICECEQRLVDDAAPVWLCRECGSKLAASEPLRARARLWPSIH